MLCYTGKPETSRAATTIVAKITHMYERQCNFVTVQCEDSRAPETKNWKILFPFDAFCDAGIIVGKTIRIQQPWYSILFKNAFP